MREDEATLCRACGLCCDGSLFARVPVTPQEVVDPRLALVTTATGAKYLPQRCASLTSEGCTTYEGRPRACRGFECPVLIALREAETSVDDAVALVTKVRALSGPEKEAALRFHFGKR